MTRVIAGVAGGRRLSAPAGRTTRPTSDRAREGLFSTVGSLRGSLEDARVLDLYAGSGAVGLEAASRGAAHVLLVESERSALWALRGNVGELGLPGVEIAAERVSRVLARGPKGGADYRAGYGAGYDLVFADPPYATGHNEVTAMLTLLASRGWLREDALVAVERDTRDDAPWPAGYVGERVRRYGGAALWYGHAA